MNDHRGSQAGRRPLRCLVAVSGDPQRASLVHALMAEEALRDVVCVESIARGYSRIKELVPDVVVLLLEEEAEPGCRLLSMLKMDDETSWIPVITWLVRREVDEFEDLPAQVGQDSPLHPMPMRMH